MTLLTVESALNLKEYPINQPGSEPYTKLVDHCRRQLMEDGACELPNFLSPKGLEHLIEESVSMAKGAYFNAVVGNAYLSATDETVAPDHPKRMTEPTRLGVIAYDEYPADAVLRSIYEYNALMLFVGDVLQLPSIHRYADPMGGLNLSVMTDGDYLRWHFDQTDFVTSIAVQTSEKGGEFEYVPMIRTANDERYGEVKKVLLNDHPGVKKIANRPGTLLLFKGRYSIHRVSEIKGPKPRLMALLAYDEKPGINSTDHLRMMRYGRTGPKQN
jgi:hypothetical protein